MRLACQCDTTGDKYVHVLAALPDFKNYVHILHQIVIIIYYDIEYVHTFFLYITYSEHHIIIINDWVLPFVQAALPDFNVVNKRLHVYFASKI